MCREGDARMGKLRRIVGCGVGRVTAAAAVLGSAGCGGGGTTEPPPVNRAPVARTDIPTYVFVADQQGSIDVAGYFSDPDGDTLTFSAVSGAPDTIEASVSGTTLTVSIVPGVTISAEVTTGVSVTARDPGGLVAVGVVPVGMIPPNRSPEAIGTIPMIEVKVGETAAVNAANYFTDPDGDNLTYSVVSPVPAIATAQTSGSVVIVTGVRSGETTIVISVRDPGGLSAYQIPTVRVTDSS